jgi:hypothetical protein
VQAAILEPLEVPSVKEATSGLLRVILQALSVASLWMLVNRHDPRFEIEDVLDVFLLPEHVVQL